MTTPQSVQQDVAPEPNHLITDLQQVSIGILDGIIHPAHLSTFAQHPFLVSALKVLLPHVGSPPLWEHPASSPKAVPKKEVSSIGGIGACAFWMERIAQRTKIRPCVVRRKVLFFYGGG